MALTVTDVKLGVVGNQFTRSATIAFDSSYPTGGESLTKADLQLPDGIALENVQINPTAGYVFEYDYTNSKVLAYYADNDAAADSALIEVANTTDLATLTGVKVTAMGA